MMGVVVLSSNYLVQFPINYFGLDEILTYGAFSYPIAFLITDLANRSYGKLLAGADYLQLYTGMVFQGPNIVSIIKKDLKELLIKDGVKNFREIVGNSRPS